MQYGTILGRQVPDFQTEEWQRKWHQRQGHLILHLREAIPTEVTQSVLVNKLSSVMTVRTRGPQLGAPLKPHRVTLPPRKGDREPVLPVLLATNEERHLNAPFVRLMTINLSSVPGSHQSSF